MNELQVVTMELLEFDFCWTLINEDHSAGGMVGLI